MRIASAFSNSVGGILGLAFAITLFIHLVFAVAVVILAVLLVVLACRLIQVAAASQRRRQAEARIAYYSNRR